MKTNLVLTALAFGATLGLTACGSVTFDGARVEKKAEEYRRTGAASDMAEARRMAENYYWPESARASADAARQARDAAMPKK